MPITLPARPRSFAERPKTALAGDKAPANDNNKAGVLGEWAEDGNFRFASPAAQEQWVRRAYQAGINADAWQQGEEIDDRSTELAAAGLGGPMPVIYQGPDGKYRTINPRTIEAADVRNHRNRHLTGKTIDQIATAGHLPGEDEWVEQWKAANDNQVVAAPLGPQAGSSAPSGENSTDQRPSLGKRFEASARTAVVDGTIFGNVVQQFRSGHAVSPEVLATRPPDRFLQHGSKGQLDWYRMYEPLGIAGGKRRVDLLSPVERKQWETVWESLTAEEQVIYRKEWEEKQKTYRPWREEFERDTALPPAEGAIEHLVDFSGGVLGSMASPESWIGMGPSAVASTGRATARGSFATAKHASADILQDVGKAETNVLAQPKRKYDPLNLMPNEKTLRLTEKDVYALRGRHVRGFAFVVEMPRGTPKSIAWEEGTAGRAKDIETRKTLSPAVLYTNSNKNGLNAVKGDGYELADNKMLLIVIDAKLRMPLFNAGGRRDAIKTLWRWNEALAQNQHCGLMLEFPVKSEMLLAQLLIKELQLSNRIYARVRPDE